MASNKFCHCDLGEWGSVERDDGLEGKALQIYIAPKTRKKGGTNKNAKTEDQQGREEAI
jgi:hypothetical protein